MKKEITVLFAMLRCGLLDEMPDAEVQRYASENAELLYKMSRHHDLAHVMYYAFKKCNIAISDEKAAYKYLKQHAMSVMRYENLNLAQSKIYELFENEKIPFVPLKGSVVRNLYAEPWMRTSCDIDILVHDEDLERARKALVEKLGYTTDGKKDFHDISLYSDTNVHLELHFNIKENMDNVDGVLSRVWEYARPNEKGAYEYRLSNEFLLFHTVSHIAFHVITGGCGIKCFFDLYLLEKEIEINRKEFFEWLEECKLKTFYDAVLKLSKIWFSDEKHDETTLVLQKYLLNGGIYGTKMNALAANSEKKSVISYILRRIFMPYEQLCITYPFLKGKKILLPFYQVRRWVRILKKRRYKNASNEIEANKSVAQNDIDEYSMLIKKLNLK